MRSSGTRFKRKRRRVRLRPKPFLWIFLVGNVIAGLLYSPITSLRHVRVEGAIPSDHARLRRILEHLSGIPCAQVNPRSVESQSCDLPEAYSADLSRNLFGSGLLKIRYRMPVAQLGSASEVGLTADGVLFHASALPKGLPMLELAHDGPPTLVGLAANWQPADIAGLAVRARELPNSGVIKITIGDRGVVCLNMDARRVVLGSSDDLTAKLDVLQRRMTTFPRELYENAELNLTESTNPALVPRKSVVVPRKVPASQ